MVGSAFCMVPLFAFPYSSSPELGLSWMAFENKIQCDTIWYEAMHDARCAMQVFGWNLQIIELQYSANKSIFSNISKLTEQT